jgi:hypothetical protein
LQRQRLDPGDASQKENVAVGVREMVRFMLSLHAKQREIHGWVGGQNGMGLLDRWGAWPAEGHGFVDRMIRQPITLPTFEVTIPGSGGLSSRAFGLARRRDFSTVASSVPKDFALMLTHLGICCREKG